MTLSALLVLTLAAVAVLILRRDEGGLPHDVGLAPTGRLLYTTGIHTPNPTVGLLPRSAHIEVLDFDAGVTTVPRGTVQPACCGTWSPDGSSFAFESLHGIRVVDATTSQGELLIASSGAHMYEASNSIGNLWPTWSPDGHLIAYSFDPAADGSFSSDDEDRAGIWVADTDRNTLGQTQLTNGPDIRPAWAPGSDVAFVRADVRPHGTAFAIMSTVGGGRIGEQQLVGASGEVSSMAWSPDGTRLAYTRIDPADDEGDIWVLEPDGSTHPVIDGPGDQRDPAWSPDGKIIAFVSDREGSDDVFIMSLEDLRTEQVTSTESSECCLSWTGTK